MALRIISTYFPYANNPCGMRIKLNLKMASIDLVMGGLQITLKNNYVGFMPGFYKKIYFPFFHKPGPARNTNDEE